MFFVTIFYFTIFKRSDVYKEICKYGNKKSLEYLKKLYGYVKAT
nr:hypothetical protein [Streptococcus agalactiae]